MYENSYRADGFIGSHLVEKLVLNGFDVNAFTYYNFFDSYGWLDHISPNIKNEINFFPGDIRDFNSKKCNSRVNKVIHLVLLLVYHTLQILTILHRH